MQEPDAEGHLELFSAHERCFKQTVKQLSRLPLTYSVALEEVSFGIVYAYQT